MDLCVELEWRRVMLPGRERGVWVPAYVHRLEFRDFERGNGLRCAGWQVRYPSEVQGSRFFCDGVFGGTRRALNAAIAYLDQVYAGEPAVRACARLGYTRCGGRKWM